MNLSLIYLISLGTLIRYDKKRKIKLLILERYTKQFKESLFVILMKNITDDIPCIKNVMSYEYTFDLLYYFMHFDRIRQEAEEKTIKT